MCIICVGRVVGFTLNQFYEKTCRSRGAVFLGKRLKYMPREPPRENSFCAITQDNLQEQLHLVVTMEQSGTKYDPGYIKRLNQRVSHLESSGYFLGGLKQLVLQVKAS